MAGKSIAARLSEVRSQVADAEKRAGRTPGSVELVAVSKTKSIDLISEAVREGQQVFAENYVQEAVAKIAALPDLQWHFIGSLQTNKVNDVVGRFSLIHSVDRERLLRTISEQAHDRGIIQDCLLQIHIGNEATKHGLSFEEAQVLASAAVSFPGVRLRGLMCLPPVTRDEFIGRGFFRELHGCAASIRKGFSSDEAKGVFDILSMGTSGDFEWAILEGATHIRVGTSIFGEREN